MKIVHISDTHGARQHSKLIIPECDLLIHSGDIGGRTDLRELTEFLVWFEAQPARCKVWVGGNHDLILDKNESKKAKEAGQVYLQLISSEGYRSAMDLITNFKVNYLFNDSFTFENFKIWGSPYTPSFHRRHWAFNADRGQEISKIWATIPSDTNILITHGPVYNFLDDVRRQQAENENDSHAGCQDLLNVIRKRLFKLKLHCSGHIHENYGVINAKLSNSRNCLFSNGAVVNDKLELLVPEPLIINL